MVLLISYDLNNGERPAAYDKVRKAIEANADSSTKALYSQWLVSTTKTISEWQTTMKETTDADDRWLIVRVEEYGYQGRLAKTAIEWLKNYL